MGLYQFYKRMPSCIIAFFLVTEEVNMYDYNYLSVCLISEGGKLLITLELVSVEGV